MKQEYRLVVTGKVEQNRFDEICAWLFSSLVKLEKMFNENSEGEAKIEIVAVNGEGGC